MSGSSLYSLVSWRGTEGDRADIVPDSTVSLYTLDELAKPRVLSQARSARTFAVGSNGSQDILVVGCRKKVVVYGAGKGRIKEAWVRVLLELSTRVADGNQELSLPHSPRHLILSSSQDPRSVFMLYSTTASALLHIDPDSTPHLSVSEVDIAHPHHAPERTSSSSEGLGVSGTAISMSKGVSALSGLGGYVGLGGKASSPVGTRTVDGEVLIGHDEAGIFLSSNGTPTRSTSLQWPAPPESVAVSNPFIFSIVPHTVSVGPSNSSSSLPTCAIQIHLAPTLRPQQTLMTLSLPSIGGLTAGSLCSVELSTNTLASSVAPSTKFLLISTPLDKSLSTTEGSSIWTVEACDLGEMIDQLVRDGHVGDAISLVESVGETGFAPVSFGYSSSTAECDSLGACHISRRFTQYSNSLKVNTKPLWRHSLCSISIPP